MRVYLNVLKHLKPIDSFTLNVQLGCSKGIAYCHQLEVVVVCYHTLDLSRIYCLFLLTYAPNTLGGTFLWRFFKRLWFELISTFVDRRNVLERQMFSNIYYTILRVNLLIWIWMRWRLRLWKWTIIFVQILGIRWNGHILYLLFLIIFWQGLRLKDKLNCKGGTFIFYTVYWYTATHFFYHSLTNAESQPCPLGIFLGVLI